MATSNPVIEQAQATQKQVLDSFVSNYEKLVELTPAETPARSAAALALEYFNRSREIIESFNGVEDAKGLVEQASSSLKATSDLNLEFSNKYAELYRSFVKQFAIVQN